MDDAMQRAKEAEWDRESARALRAERQARYALQSPSGNIIGMGTEKPKLSKEDRRNFWRVIRLGSKSRR